MTKQWTANRNLCLLEHRIVSTPSTANTMSFRCRQSNSSRIGYAKLTFTSAAELWSKFVLSRHHADVHSSLVFTFGPKRRSHSSFNDKFAFISFRWVFNWNLIWVFWLLLLFLSFCLTLFFIVHFCNFLWPNSGMASILHPLWRHRQSVRFTNDGESVTNRKCGWIWMRNRLQN